MSLAWCYTINNPTASDEACVVALVDQARYHIVGRETGDNGTPHLQGYVYMKMVCRLSKMAKLLPRAHIEKAKGSAEQNREYCSKGGDFCEDGVMPMSQKRKGECGKEYWADVLHKAKKGKFEEIDPQIYVKFHRNLHAIAKDHAPMPADADDTTGLWYYGPSGTGKSRAAREEFPGLFLKTCNKWWDGYNGEDFVLIEDFDKKHGESLCYFLKIWADRYAFPAEIKGGKINLRPKKIIVTSNYHPSQIWKEPEDLEPILRRFIIKEFN